MSGYWEDKLREFEEPDKVIDELRGEVGRQATELDRLRRENDRLAALAGERGAEAEQPEAGDEDWGPLPTGLIALRDQAIADHRAGLTEPILPLDPPPPIPAAIIEEDRDGEVQPARTAFVSLQVAEFVFWERRGQGRSVRLIRIDPKRWEWYLDAKGGEHADA